MRLQLGVFLVLCLFQVYALPKGNVLVTGTQGNHLEFPAPLTVRLDQDWSVSLWSSMDMGASKQPIISIGTTACNNQQMSIISTNTGTPVIDMGGAACFYSNNYQVYSSFGPFTIRWLHLALTYQASSGTTWAYVNGRQVLVKNSAFFAYSASTFMRFGGRTMSDSASGAYIDDVRIWTRTLSASEIASDMLSDTPVSSTSLVGWHDMETVLPSGQVQDRLALSNGTLYGTARLTLGAYVSSISSNVTQRVLYLGDYVDIYLTMSRPVWLTSTPMLNLTQMVAPLVAPALNTNTTVLTFRYQVQANHTAGILNLAAYDAFLYPEYVQSVVTPSMMVPPPTSPLSLLSANLVVSPTPAPPPPIIYPDATSALVCNATSVVRGGSVACTIFPRLNNTMLAVTPSLLSPSVTAAYSSMVTFSALSPATSSTIFTFVATFSVWAPCGVAFIRDGVSWISSPVMVRASPVSGVPTTLLTPVGSTLSLPLLPATAAVAPAFIRTDMLTLSDGGQGGSWRVNSFPSPDAFGYSLVLRYVVGASTGLYNLSVSTNTSQGLPPLNQSFAIQVYDTPDVTSLFTCSSTFLLGAGSINCTLIPRKGSQTIFALASAYSPRALITTPAGATQTANYLGTFSAITPSFGTSFNVTFQYTYPNGGNFQLNDGISSTLINATVIDVATTIDVSCLRPIVQTN